MTTQEIRNNVRELKAMLEAANVAAIFSVADSTTDFGCSSYLIVKSFDGNVSLKVRCSDHGVGTRRAVNELHIYNNELNSVFESIERIFHADRYEAVLVSSWKEMLYNAAKLDNITSNYEVINPAAEVKNSGKVMAAIRIEEFKTVFVRK